MLQHMCLTAYEEHTVATLHKLERLSHENAIPRSGAHPPSEQDRKLHVAYCRLSEAEHGWNHTRMLLNITREEVDTRTHGIIHLEYHVETQDAKLEERVEMITNLEQQLLQLQGPARLTPVDHEEIDATSGINED
jgi:hypothetical protein